MLTPIRSHLCLVLVAACAPALAGSLSGRVLILDNEHTLEGEITREGEQYRIRRGSAETWVPGDRVLFVCASNLEAYRYLRTRANLGDVDERLRLARWCHLHNLREEAVVEATAAVNMQPRSTEALQLLHALERSAQAAKSRPAVAGRDEPGPSPALPVDFNPEALGLFGTRVQPILMNTCASCHSADHAGAFRLQRVFENGLLDRRATQHNLAAVLGQINPEHPLASPLLAKAVTVHGTLSQAPLKGRQAAAYRTLEEWVRLAVGPGAPHEPGAPAAEPKPSAEPPAAEGVVAKPAAPGPPSAFASPPPVAPPATPVPASGQPVDPFDPALFNRQMHPRK
jgi:hypothetical protein